MKRILFSGLLSLIIAIPVSGDLAGWIRSTDRTLNREIVRVMAESDLATTLEIARALGSRPDTDCTEIFIFYDAVYRQDERDKAELILTTLLRSLFPEQLTRDEKATRYRSNREALDRLLSGLTGFAGADLKRELIRLIPLIGDARFHPLIAEEGGRLVDRMKKTGGGLLVTETEELLAILDVIETLSLADLRELCTQFIRSSNNRMVVRRARAVAGTL